MTGEVLPPALSTRRTRAAGIIASAAAVLRHGGRDAEIVMLDGTTVTAGEFAALVQTAKRHDGMVDRETQRHIDHILAVAGERDPLSWAMIRPEESQDAITTRIAGYGAIALLCCLVLIPCLWWAAQISTDATLAQATQAQFIEYSPEAHQ